MPPTPQDSASGQPSTGSAQPSPTVVIDPDAAAPVVNNPPAVPVGAPPAAMQTPLQQPTAVAPAPAAEPVYAAPAPAPVATEPAPAVPPSDNGTVVQPAAGVTAPQPAAPGVQMQAMAPQPGAYDTVRKAGLAGMIGAGLAFFTAFATVLGANYNFVIVIPVAIAMAAVSFLVFQGGSMKTIVLLLKILLITTAVTMVYSLIRAGFLAVLWGAVIYFVYKAFADLYKDNLTTSAKFWEAKAK